MMTPIVSHRGFTLVEVLIALLMGSVVLTAVMSSFHIQHKTYLVQDEVVAMQQNARMAMDLLTRDLRTAGYDPTGNSGAGIITANATQLVFTQDLDGSGGTYISQADPVENDAAERLSYRLNANPPALGRVTGFGVIHLSVADDIAALEFNYLLDDDTRTLAPADLTRIRSVQVSLLATTSVADSKFTDTTTYTTGSGATWGPFNDGFRRQLLIQTVVCRNLGLTP